MSDSNKIYDDAVAAIKREARASVIEEFISNGLQVRRDGEKNHMVWWYADGSNLEGNFIGSLLNHLEEKDKAVKETP